MELANILLQAPGGSGMTQLIMFGAIGFIFYFFMIRPQTKKAKETKKFREQLQKGQKIVTIGGVHGKIAEIKDTTLILEVEGGNRLKIERSAISQEFSTGTGTSTLEQGAK